MHNNTLKHMYFHLLLQDNLVSNTTRLIQNTATFSDCLFDSNSSPTGGSAVGLVSHARVDKAVAAANFTDW